MFCWRSSHITGDDPWHPRSQRRSRAKAKNPYSNRGLDKLAKLIKDLEARREKIMAQMGEQGNVSLIRFVYSNSQGWVPIVVKIKDGKQGKLDDSVPASRPIQQNSEKAIKLPIRSSAAANDVSKLDGKMKKSSSWSSNKSDQTDLWRPCYWPSVVILVLFCLVMFGRSFAIICTSIWWYLVPTLKGGDVNMRRSIKKEYERRLSEKR